MMIETFGQCLADWLLAQDISAITLTGLLHLSSKTTVNRVRNDECSPQQCQKLLDMMIEKGLLDADWQQRFAAAMHTSELGVSRACFYRELEDVLLSVQSARPAYDPFARRTTPYPGDPQALIVLGCAGSEIISAIDDALHTRSCTVAHVVTTEDLLEKPCLLTMMMRHMLEPRYTAYVLDAAKWDVARLPWNMMLVRTEAGEHVGLWHEPEPAFFLAKAGVMAHMQQMIEAAAPVPVYANGEMTKATDYIRILEDCLRIEKGKHSCIVKGTPCLQMIAPQYIERAFFDREANGFTNMIPAGRHMLLILEKRFQNFCTKKARTQLVFSEEAMDAFVSAGLLDDHFFACSPFSVEERRGILTMLLSLCDQPQFSLAISTSRHTSCYAYEAYRGVGTIIFPAATNYNAELGGYREMFLPGDVFAERFEGFTRDVLIPHTCVAGEEAVRRLRHAIGHLV